jgi:hypothetical protein
VEKSLLETLAPVPPREAACPDRIGERTGGPPILRCQTPAFQLSTTVKLSVNPYRVIVLLFSDNLPSGSSALPR